MSKEEYCVIEYLFGTAKINLFSVHLSTYKDEWFLACKELNRIISKIDTNEIIIMPESLKTLNRNIIIFGASGSGKSRKFIIPNILKIAEQDEKEKEIHKNVSQGKNFVCTDPKGELYSKTCKMLEKRGYKVKLLNLVNPLYSDGIDLIKFIEEKVDAQVFAQVVMSATQNVGTKKRRWVLAKYTRKFIKSIVITYFSRSRRWK